MAAPNIVNVSTISGKTAVQAVSTSATAIVTNSASSGKVYKVNSLLVSNVDGINTAEVTIDLYRSSTAYHLIKTASITAGSTLDLLVKTIYLEEGDSIRLTGSALSDLEAVCSYEEIDSTGSGATGIFSTLTATGNTELGDTEATDTHAIKGATTLLANTSSDALRITQTGSGNALVVEDSANPDSTPFVVDSTGRVLVGHTSNVVAPGESSPALQLHGLTGSLSTVAITNWANNAVSTPILSLNKSTSGVIETLGSVSSGDFLGALQFTGDDGTSFIRAASIVAQVDGTPGTNDMPGRLVFSTTADGASSPTERMRINSSGNVGIGTSSPGFPLHIKNNTSGVYLEESDGTSTHNSSYIVQNSDNLDFQTRDSSGSFIANDYSIEKGSSGAILHRWRIADSEKMRINSSGNVGIGVTSISYQLQLSTDSAGKPSTNTWTIVSDERIKENIELANLDLCYDAVKNIPLKRFKWRDEVYSEEQVADRHKLGWIAQDVESVYPKAVNIHEFRYNQIYNETIIPATEDEPERTEKELVSEDVIEDCRNLNADQIYAAMYGAIQKLIQKVETLETRIAKLEA